MGLRKPSEQRFFPRYYDVAAGFNGKLVLKTTEEPLLAKVLDVSRDGLGVLLDRSVKRGDTIELVFLEKRIALNVVYCNDDLIYQGKYRCGLQRAGSSNENLVSLFSAAGVIKL